MSDKVKVVCNKDQRWSFGTFKKGQVIEVTVDIGKTFVEAGYGDYFKASGEEKQVGSPATENKMLNPAEDNKSKTIDFRKFTKKNDLESYAKKTYGVDLDKKKTIKVMVEELENFLENTNYKGDE